MFKFAVVAFLVLSLTGCIVPSLNPLVSPQAAVAKPELLGTWVDTESANKYMFMQAEDGAYGLAATTADGKESHFLCYLVQLGGKLFLDMYPAELDALFDTYAPWHVMPVHSFYMLELDGDKMTANTLNPSWLLDLGRDEPGAIGLAEWYFEEGDALPLLTADTARLQEFFTKYAATPEAFYGEIKLARVK